MDTIAPEQLARDTFLAVSGMGRLEALELAAAHATLPWVRAAIRGHLGLQPVHPSRPRPRVLVFGVFAVPRGAVPWPTILVGVQDGPRSSLVAVFRSPAGAWTGRALAGSSGVPWRDYRGDPAGPPGTASQGDVPWLALDLCEAPEGVVVRGLSYLRVLLAVA